MSKNKKSNGKVGLITWASVTAFLLVFLMVLTILEQGMLNPILTTILGGKKPILADESSGYSKIYKSDYNSKDDSIAAGERLNLEIEKEGATLLVNEDNALPIAKGSKVSVFGKNSVDLVLGGSGSGSGSGDQAKTLYDGLTSGGFEFNPELKSFYESSASGKGRSSSPKLSENTAVGALSIGETPVADYPSSVRNSFAKYSDAAIVVISRIGGESWDLPRVQEEGNGGAGADRHYLQLDDNEYDLLDMVTSRFDKVIVVLNTLTSFQCDFIEEYNNTLTDKRIDAVLWIGGPGRNGAEAFGAILNGDVNPSGKTVDIYSKDFTKDPTWVNFGDNSQVAGGIPNTAFMSTETDSLSGGVYNMVTYEEGVYLGYRYYETRAFVEEDPDWYSENVMFPFGYGLSYSTFKREITSVEGSLENGGSITVNVKITNVSGPAGKDVAQLYVSKPYIENGIEKSHIELVDFAKTDLLAKDGHNEFSFKVDAYDLASYDYMDANKNGHKGYELDAGDYTFYVGGSSHVWADAADYEKAVVKLENGVTFDADPVTNNPVENLYTFGEYQGTSYVFDDYDDLQYRLSDVRVGSERRKGMSRTNFADTFPTPLTVKERLLNLDDEKKGYTEQTKLESYDHNNIKIEEATKDKEIPEMGKTGSDIILHDLLGEDGRVAFSGEEIDAKWEELLSKITFEEMLNLVNNGAFQTVAIESIGKNLTNDSDGPIGFVNFMGGAVSAIFEGNNNFATQIVIGSTWNKDLAYQMGLIVGENGLWGDQSGNNSLPYSGWYAPGINLHRSPFSGRNFEYYSEDPILTGKMAVNVVGAARTKGVYSDLKHFAVNDQETNRGGVSTFLTEQALRELYLKPFELAVKGDDAPRTVKMFGDNVEDKVVNKYEGAIGVMSSFNRIGNKFTGGDYRLLTTILRDEWGFRGLVICDYKTSNLHMNSRQMLYAGNDLLLTSLPQYYWGDAKADSVQDVTVLRDATKNILYTVANSNSIQVKILGYSSEWWIVATIVVDCLAAVGLGVWGFFAVRKFLKNRKNGNEANAVENE